MKVTKSVFVLMKGEKTFKKVYKLIGKTIKGEVPRGA